MKEIPLTQGRVALVDDEDYERLARYKWTFQSHKGGEGYAFRSEPQTRIRIHMHREILGVAANMLTDHWNRHSLDNRRANLRACTRSQNAANRGKGMGGRSSQYKGVSWHRRTQTWQASIRSNRERYWLGHFVSEAVAAQAYNAAALRLFGEFALLNEIAS